MNTALWVIFIEVFLVTFAALGLMVMFNWKRKKRNNAFLEQLLEQYQQRRETRKEDLLALLGAHLQLSDEQADSVCSHLMVFEKKFLQDYVESQIKNTLDTDLYLNLCSLLDGYLKSLPEYGVSEQEADQVAAQFNLDDDDDDMDWQDAFSDDDDDADQKVTDETDNSAQAEKQDRGSRYG